MKNKILLFFFSLFLTGSAMAQNSRIGQHETITSWTPRSSFATTAEGKQIAQEIIDVVGLKANFEIQAANVPNAAAVTYGGKRYILYNPTFITQLNKQTGTKWAAISVLAHEIGHHLNGHTITGTGSQPAIELEADEFSGFVLRKMGASLTEAQAAMKLLAGVQDTKTHPGQDARLASIHQGWENADAQVAGRKAVAIARPKPVTRPSTPVVASTPQRSGGSVSRPTISERNIIGEVRFTADPRSAYYITRNLNLVKVSNAGTEVIAKIAGVNNRDYPFVIYDEANTQLVVDNRGNILNSSGRKVGTLSSRA
jgi:hypothetical protein